MDNVSKWSNMSVRGLFFSMRLNYKYPTKRAVLVQSGHHHHDLIENVTCSRIDISGKKILNDIMNEELFLSCMRQLRIWRSQMQFYLATRNGVSKKDIQIEYWYFYSKARQNISIELKKLSKNCKNKNAAKYYRRLWHNNVIENSDVIWKSSVSNGNIRLYLIRNIYASILNIIWQDIIFKVGHVFI